MLLDLSLVSRKSTESGKSVSLLFDLSCLPSDSDMRWIGVLLSIMPALHVNDLHSGIGSSTVAMARAVALFVGSIVTLYDNLLGQPSSVYILYFVLQKGCLWTGVVQLDTLFSFLRTLGSTCNTCFVYPMLCNACLHHCRIWECLNKHLYILLPFCPHTFEFLWSTLPLTHSLNRLTCATEYLKMWYFNPARLAPAHWQSSLPCLAGCWAIQSMRMSRDEL